MAEEPTPATAENLNVDYDLVAEYEAADSNRTIARRTITLTIIFMFLAFLANLYFEVSYFVEEEVEVFVAELGAEATAYAPEFSRRLQGLANTVVPRFIDTLANTYADNEEEYVELLVEEFQKLEIESREAWPRMEEAIAKLVIEQEEAARRELEGIISSDDIAEVSLAYRVAMENYLEDLFETYFTEQAAAGDRIMANLALLAEVELDDLPDDNQYLIGMMIELLGKEMQNNSLWVRTPDYNNPQFGEQ